MSDSARIYHQIALLFFYQIDLIVFQTTDGAGRVHVYTHLAAFWAEMQVKLIVAVERAKTRVDRVTEFEIRNSKSWNPEISS